MRRLKKTLAVALALVMLLGVVPIAANAEPTEEPWQPPFNIDELHPASDIRITGESIDWALTYPNAMPWKGFGMLHCNSTSALLMDYKAEHPDKYWEMMEFLFGGDRPLIVKIKNEMGNDGNNSTGADEASMRHVVCPVTGELSFETVADTSRAPGFQFMADAKTIQPGVKTSTLRWRLPNWVNDEGTAPGTTWPATVAQRDRNSDRIRYEAIYEWHKQTVIDQYRRYGFVWDEIAPDHNENNNPNPFVIRYFYYRIHTDMDFPADLLADEYFMQKYRGMLFIASDENQPNPNTYEGIRMPRAAYDMLDPRFNPMPNADQEGSMAFTDIELASTGLLDIVDIKAWHYAQKGNPATHILWRDHDIEMWNSEGTAIFGMAFEHANKTVGTRGPNSPETSDRTAGSLGGHQSPLSMLDFILINFHRFDARRTFHLYQPLIGGMYEGHQYCHKNMLNMVDPWSGYIQYNDGFNLNGHITWFAQSGWETWGTSPTTPAEERTGVWYALPQASHSFNPNPNAPDEHRWNGGGNNAGTTGDLVPSYMTLASPTKDDFSIIFANNTHLTMQYRISYSDLAGKLANGDYALEIWETKASSYMKYLGLLEVSPDGFFYFEVDPWTAVTLTTLRNAPLSWRNQEVPDEVGTRLHGMRMPQDPNPRSVLNFGADPEAHQYVDIPARPHLNQPAYRVNELTLFADDFGAFHNDPAIRGIQVPHIREFLVDGGTDPDLIEWRTKSYGEAFGWQPRFAMMNAGAFEVMPLDDDSRGTPGTLRSLLNRNINNGQWNAGSPSFTFGDFRWMDYKASVDVHFPDAPNHQGINTGAGTGNFNAGIYHSALVIRSQGGMNMNLGLVNNQFAPTPNAFLNMGYILEIRPTGEWRLVRGNGTGVAFDNGILAQGNVEPAREYNLALQGHGAEITAWINGIEVFRGICPAPLLSGRVRIGNNWGIVEYDNIIVERTPLGIPFAHEFLFALSYEVVTSPGNWTKSAGNDGGSQNANTDWGRSRATSRGASVENPAWFEFSMSDATGFAIIGHFNAAARLNIYIDGQLYLEDERLFANSLTTQSATRNPTYLMSGLPRGDYDVRVEIVAGQVAFSGLYIFEEIWRDDATLEAISLTDTNDADVPLIPEFDPGTLVYDAFVGRLMEAVTLEYIVNCEFARGSTVTDADGNVIEDGVLNLVPGINTFVITVIPEDFHSVGVYTLNITRPAAGFTGTSPSQLNALLARGDVTIATPGSGGYGIASGVTLVVPEGRTLYVESILNVRRDATLIIEGTVVVLEGGRLNSDGHNTSLDTGTIIIAEGGKLINYGYTEIAMRSTLTNNGTITNNGTTGNLGRFEVRAGVEFLQGLVDGTRALTIHREAIIIK